MLEENRLYITDSLINYSRYMFESTRGIEFRYNFHHGLVCDKLERVMCGLSKRLIINIPPRFSKTELAVINFTSWALGHYPDAEFIHASYSAGLAANNSYQIRNILQHEAYSELFAGTSLADDSKARHWWKTQQGGAFYAAGANGTITGFGAGKIGRGFGHDSFGGAIIIDDPHKAKEAKNSLKSRKNIQDWFKGTIETRLNDQDTPIIIIMQRLHEDDLTGWLLGGGNGEPWDNLVIPAVLPNNMALWPAKMSREELRRIEASKPYEFSGQYMQRPIPLGGGMFKDAWLSHRYRARPNFLRIIQSWDTAQKDKIGRNDPSVCTTWGVTSTGYYLLDVFVKHLEYPDLLQRSKDLAAAWNPHLILIEDKSSGSSLIQDLRRNTRLPVHAVEPEGSKIDRAESVTGDYEAGLVLLPESAPWIAGYIAELTTFPLSANDDQVDSSSQFLAYMRKNAGRSYAVAGSRHN